MGTVKKKGLLMDTWQFWGLNLGPLNYRRAPLTAAGLALSPAEPLKREMSSGGGDDSVHIGNDFSDTKDDLAVGGNNVLQCRGSFQPPTISQWSGTVREQDSADQWKNEYIYIWEDTYTYTHTHIHIH